jgi:hypothetical protein
LHEFEHQGTRVAKHSLSTSTFVTPWGTEMFHARALTVARATLASGARATL